jgi:hypothetical protein
MIARSIPRMPIVRGNEPQYFTTKGDAGIFAIEIRRRRKLRTAGSLRCHGGARMTESWGFDLAADIANDLIERTVIRGN